MARIVRGESTRLALVLILAGGCLSPGTTVGHIPEKPTREIPEEAESAAAHRHDAFVRRQNASLTGDSKVVDVRPADARIGVVTNHEFHRTECELVKGVPTADQLRFVSYWDALDEGYRPCEKCRPIR